MAHVRDLVSPSRRLRDPVNDERELLSKDDMKYLPAKIAKNPGPQYSTQVSFPPPPCEELTTSDPFLSATLVSPPGMTCISFPYST